MDFLLCKVCHMQYDEEDNRPRNAPCGHEFCSSCIRVLIKNGLFQCPKCRQTTKVYVPEDMPVSFGLIEAIRAFKSKAFTTSTSESSVALMEKMCSNHCKAITHWCITCNIWICGNCVKFHSSLMGCSTTNSAEAMESIKDKHIKDSDMLLTIFEEDINGLSTKMEEHIKEAEKHAEEAKRCHKLLDEGTELKNKFKESQNHLNIANSPNSVSVKINVLTQRKQLLRNWAVINMAIDTPFDLSKAIEKNREVFSEIELQSENIYARLTKQEESIYFHTFWKQSLGNRAIVMPFSCLQKMIPPCPTLVFLELSMGGMIKGQVLLRLNKDLPNIRDHMVKLVTGQNGQSLREVKFNGNSHHGMYANGLSNLITMKVTTDENKDRDPTAKSWDVLCGFYDGYLQNIFFFLPTTPQSGYELYHLVGTIEKGMDILLDCHNVHTINGPLIISDCGLVIEKQ